MKSVTSGWGRGGSYRRGAGGVERWAKGVPGRGTGGSRCVGRGSGAGYGGGYRGGLEGIQRGVHGRGVGGSRGCRGVVSEGLGQGMVRFRGVGRRSRTIKLVHSNPNSCAFAIMALIQKLLLPPSHSGLPPQPTHPAKRRLIIRHVSSVSPSRPAGVRQITHSSRRRRPVGS